MKMTDKNKKTSFWQWLKAPIYEDNNDMLDYQDDTEHYETFSRLAWLVCAIVLIIVFVSILSSCNTQKIYIDRSSFEGIDGKEILLEPVEYQGDSMIQMKVIILKPNKD